MLLSVESARRTAAGQPPLSVLAERSVLQRLKDHRLHELLSTGHPLESFGRLVELEEGHRVILGVEGLAMTPLRARHAEVAFGLLIEHRGSPVLGWTVRGCGWLDCWCNGQQVSKAGGRAAAHNSHRGGEGAVFHRPTSFCPAPGSFCWGMGGDNVVNAGGLRISPW